MASVRISSVGGYMTGKTAVALVLTQVVVIGIATAAIVAIYYWLLPKFFPGQKTYSVLIIGTFGSAALGGLAAKWFMNEAATTTSWVTCIAVGIVTGTVAMILSIGILVSLMGS
jgi:hypothetical protein